MLKNANIGGKWITVELNDEDKEKALEELLEGNIKELARCVEASETAFIACKGALANTEIIRMLYEKQATASYSALSQALDKKLHNLRNPVTNKKEPVTNKKELSPEEEKKIHETSSKMLQKPEKKENDPSVLDQYFDDGNL